MESHRSSTVLQGLSLPCSAISVVLSQLLLQKCCFAPRLEDQRWLRVSRGCVWGNCRIFPPFLVGLTQVSDVNFQGSKSQSHEVQSWDYFLQIPLDQALGQHNILGEMSCDCREIPQCDWSPFSHLMAFSGNVVSVAVGEDS